MNERVRFQLGSIQYNTFILHWIDKHMTMNSTGYYHSSMPSPTIHNKQLEVAVFVGMIIPPACILRFTLDFNVFPSSSSQVPLEILTIPLVDKRGLVWIFPWHLEPIVSISNAECSRVGVCFSL